MQDDQSHIVGIRLRLCDGRKLAVRGGHEGLFIPGGLRFGGPLLLAEGPTDCAALLDLGFEAIGRPSCSGGIRHCVPLVRAHWPLEVVVVADNDPPGRQGAENLAVTLLPYARTVRIIFPPASVKDIRAWKLDGATHADVANLITNAVARQLTISEVRYAK
jgi:hypothetical protein